MIMSIKKLMEIDSRYLYLVMLILVSIPIIQPLGLPVRPSAYAIKVYNFIESLPPESVVVIDAAQSAGYGAELQTQYVAILKHVLKKDVKLIIVSFSAEGPMLVDMAYEGGLISGKPVDPAKYGDVYGEDYVYLGYIPGEETAFVSFARDCWMTKVDASGTPLEELPIMQYCKTAEDWNVIISFTGGAHEQRIAQWYNAYLVPLIFGVPGVSAPRMYSYMASGQVYSMLSSLIGAAEYEILTNEIGLAAALMDVLNLGQLCVVAAVIIGNLGYILTRIRGGK